MIRLIPACSIFWGLCLAMVPVTSGLGAGPSPGKPAVSIVDMDRLYSTPPVPAPPKIEWTAEQRKEIEELARRTVEAFTDSDSLRLRQVMDTSAFCARIVAGLGFPEALRREVVETIEHGFAVSHGGVLGTFDHPQDSDFAFLRLVDTHGELAARLRYNMAVRHVVYLDLIAGRNAEGKIHWVDFRASEFGDTDTSLRRHHVYTHALKKGYLGAKATAALTPWEGMEETFGTWQSKYTGAEPPSAAEVQKEFTQLGDMRSWTPFLFLGYLKMMALSATPDTVPSLRTATQFFLAAYPGHPAAPWVRYLQGIYAPTLEEQLAACDEMDRVYGPDAFFDAIRAGLFYQKKDYAKALDLAQKAAAALPDARLPHQAIVRCSLETGNFELTLQELTVLQKRFHGRLDPRQMAEDPGWKAFMESPSGKVWLGGVK